MSTITGFVGRMSGLLEVQNNMDARVRVEREVMLDRDSDGVWVVSVACPDAGEDRVAGLVALDPHACRFLDRFAALLANPDEHAGREHRIESPAALPAA